MYRLVVILAVLTLAVQGCDSNKRKNTGELDDATPYVANGPYADWLRTCAQVKKISSCRLTDLPPLAMETPNFTKDDILNRVLVSHTWMGDNFSALLDELPDDLIQMFGAVTVIAIDSDIRPSYYWRQTGAIYLDPFNLWLNSIELRTISTQQDYRLAYADPMSFRSVWRTTKDGESATVGYGFDYIGSRPMEHIVIPMSSLLFHELAHANDLLPPMYYDQIDKSGTFLQATDYLLANTQKLTLSIQLDEQYPLSSQVMEDLAGILYLGDAPTDHYKAIQAAEVGSHFEPDDASDDYAYTNHFEDFAMLVEEAMMKIHFDVDRDIAFITAPGENGECEDYVIGWGTRNRVGEDRIKLRAQFAMEAIWPEQDFTQALDDLPTPTPLTVGQTWWDCTPATASAKTAHTSSFLKRTESQLRPYDLHTRFD